VIRPRFLVLTLPMALPGCGTRKGQVGSRTWVTLSGCSAGSEAVP
jgi:hypothetical protein